jgi:hypothetical protein
MEPATAAVFDQPDSITEVSDEDMGTISHLNHEGDTKYTWNRKNLAECDAAREHFDALRAKGFLAFKVTPVGLKGKPVSGFNPNAGKYLFTAPEMATKFEPRANYVMTPQFQGG